MERAYKKDPSSTLIGFNFKKSCQSNGHETEKLRKLYFLNAIPVHLCEINNLKLTSLKKI